MSTSPDREVDAPADELLEVGSRPPADRRRRWIVAVLAIVVAVPIIVLSLRHSSSPKPSAAPTTPTSSPVSSPAPVRPSTVRLRDPCQGIAGCVVRSGVSPALAALARRHLSPDVVVRVHTYLVVDSRDRPTRLVERDLDAYYRSATVALRVDHGSDTTSALTPDPPGVGSLLLHQSNAGFTVRLQYLAPETVPPMMTDLLNLMKDPHLTTV